MPGLPKARWAVAYNWRVAGSRGSPRHLGGVLSLYRITSRMQEIIASTVMGRPKQVAGLMERLAAAAAAPDPTAGILEAVFDEIGSRMPTDRLSIAAARHDEGQYTDIAARGIDIPGWDQQTRHPLKGSLVQAALSGGAPLRVDGDSAEALETQYPALKPEMDAGLRAWLSVPMAYQGRHVGALVIASKTPRAYTDDHAAFGELVAAAASEVAGGWLSEMAQAGALEENVLAGLGQLLLSSNPDEAYAALATRLWKVAPFDLLAVVLVGPGQDSARTAFAAGFEEAAWDAAQTYPVEPGALQNLVGVEGKLITDESPELLASVAAQWPPMAVEGIRTVAAAPLPSISGHAGALVLASTTPGSLARPHLQYVRQAAAMLSGCLVRDDLLRQGAARSREEDGLAAMGRAVSSAANLEAALADAAAILKGLVPADRIEVASADDGRLLYAFGHGPDGHALASLAPDPPGPVVVGDASTPTAQASFPSLRPYVQAGLRSFMSVPLAYGGKTVGSLAIGSNTPDAFDGPRHEVVLRAATHVAGAISALTALDRLRDVRGRARALADLSSAIRAPGDPASLLEAAAPPLRRLVPYDRLDAFAIAGGEAPATVLYSTGIPLDVDAIAGAVAEALAGVDSPLLMAAGAATAYGDAGINSVMALPITGGGALIAGIALGSTAPGAYGDADLEAARVAANVLAGPLYGMAVRAEHSAARKEMETIAEIGRVASSTIDTREVYGKLAELIGTLLLYDRLSVWTTDMRRESLSMAFTAGVDASGEEGSEQAPVSSREMLGALTSGVAATGDRAEELSRKLFGPLSHAAANLPAVLLAPLVTDEGTVGLLSLRTSRPNAYTLHDAAVAEMVASQLAGPMANSQMHAEYKRVEESVREVVQRLERAVTGSGEGLWDWNISEGQVWWSPRLKQMIGVDETEGAGGLRGLETRVHPGDRERVFQCLSEHLERRTPFDVTYRIETGPGEIRWFWDRGRAIWNESGSPVRMSGSIRDVTESKDGADHGYPSSVDLHLPLRTIESFRQTLLEGSLSESGQDGTAIAARAAPYARRMEALVNDLGTLSQAMDAPLQRTEVDLSALARSIARGLRRDEPERAATISVASGLKADGDPDLMEMVLEELIGNALKFTSNTEDARIEVGSSDETGAMAYYVRDNGVGFDSDSAGSVFDLFQRLHSDEEFEGTGVGLAIVRHVVRRHGGRVWAEGAVGEGATVHFTL